MEDLDIKRQIRFKGKKALFFSLCFLGLMLLLSFTPIAWHLLGKPDESYPELLFLFYGVPLALFFMVLACTRMFVLKWKV